MWKLATLLIAISTTADAQTCGPRDHLIAQLEGKRWQERTIMVETAPNGQSAKILAANTETGTWIVYAITTFGIACILGVGTNDIVKVVRI